MAAETFDIDAAKQKIMAYLKSPADSGDAPDELVVLDSQTEEHDFGWIFYYNSRKFLETQDENFMLVGNAPLIFERETGHIFETGTAYAIEHYLKNYHDTGDPNRQFGRKIQLVGFDEACKTADVIKAIRWHCDLNLPDAKKLVDMCSQGKTPIVETKSVDDANELAEALANCGAKIKRLSD